MSGWRLAIDFGTSNSAAARASDGSVQVVPLSHYGNLMPSAVLSDDYGFSVGVAALHQAEAEPGGFFPEPQARHHGAVVASGGPRLQGARGHRRRVVGHHRPSVPTGRWR